MAGLASPALASSGGGGGSSTITSLLGITTAGQKAMSGSLSVAIASDQSAIAVTGTFFQATQPVSGTVTANAGTNLNTSALNLESTQVAFSGKFAAATALSDVFANPTTAPVGAFGMNWDTTEWQRVRGGLGDGAGAGGMSNVLPMMYNGATHDRFRSVVNATNSTGTGISAAGILAQFDDVAPTSITENQFGNSRMSANRNLYTTIRDAAGNERGANVTASNELNVLATQKDVFAAATTFTITLASLASSTAGVGRQSNTITSNTAKSALIAVKFTAGTSPTANSLVYVYLIRGDGTLIDDNAGASDAGITIINAPLLGTILVSAATSNATYYGMFDTKFLGSLGPTFGIAVVNSTGATANATGGNFSCEYSLIT